LDGLIWLEDQKEDPKDWLFWEKLHKKLFGKVWRWAGRFRQIELHNDEFNHPGYISQNIKRLEGDLIYWLSPEAKMEKKEAITRFHEGLLTIHPFTNGNGRTSRILAHAICKYEKIEVPT
jgi:fido (protein-threonine AMPylation protein)